MSRRQLLWLLFAALGIVGLATFPLLFRVADGIATHSFLGPSQSPPPNDIGPVYIRIPGGANTDREEYGYVATAEREAQIIAGFRKLKVGQSREDARNAMGPPDSAIPMHQKARNMPFIGWCYQYELDIRSGPTNMNSVFIDVFFNPDGTLTWAVPNHIAGLEEVGSY